MTLAGDVGANPTTGDDQVVATQDELFGRIQRSELPWLENVRRISWIVFSLQFLALAIWSTVLYERFAGTLDEAGFLQAFYLISHGHLDPYSTTMIHLFVQDHGSVFLWLAAPLDSIGPRGLLILWLQDFAVVAGGVIAFQWIYKITTDRRIRFATTFQPVLLCGLGLFVLVANPWTYWSLSFDLHTESFAAPFIIAAAFDLSQKRFTRAWIWVACTMLFGDVAASWVFGLGISALIAGFIDHADRKRLWKHALLLGMSGLAWAAGLTALNLTKGSSFKSDYGYLTVSPGARIPTNVGPLSLAKAFVAHPLRFVGALTNNLWNTSANVAPTGWIGIMTTWTIGVPFVILLENDLGYQHRFSNPSYQSLPIYTFGAVGVIIVLAWAISRWRLRIILNVIVAVLVVNCMLWAMIFVPNIKSTWLHVSEAQAAVLSRVEAKIPVSAEVVVSQGVSARFASRANVYTPPHIFSEFPVVGNHVWFVITPTVGIELFTLKQYEVIDQLEGPMHAKLITAADGIYVFKWHRPENVHYIDFNFKSQLIPAWVAVGSSGVGNYLGPKSSWHVSSTGVSGYVISGDYWSEPVGKYLATVTLSNKSPIFVEVWNDSSDVLLARDELTSNSRTTKVTMPFDVTQVVPQPSSYSGVGPFKITPIPNETPHEDRLEIRVWSAAGGSANVYSVSIRKSS